MVVSPDLAKRDRCYNSFGYYDCYNGWYYWGRWVLAGIALLAFFLVLLSCCLIARRRRRRGAQPYYGTGWMAPPPKYGDNQNSYPMNNQQQQGGYYSGGPGYNPPPAYGQQAHQPQYTGTTFNPNDGYYGNQQYPDANVQSPPNVYQPNVYAPPTGK